MGRLRRRTRPLRHGIALVFLRGFAGLLRTLPLPWALGLGAGTGRLIGLLARRDRRRVAEALALSLAEPPPVGDCFADLGRRVAAWVNAARVLPTWRVDAAALACWEAARAEGRGVLVATAHLGNWELLGAALARAGVPVVAVGARSQGGPLYRWLARERAALGLRVLGPGGGAREARARLAAGETVAFFVDQATRERSRLVPFFGRPAPVPLTVERLQAATGAPVLFVWSAPDGAGTTIHAERLPADRPLDAATARLEGLIRADPRRWVWLHARWPAVVGSGDATR
ncbi:MAG: lysophospholipid acyltransferase family protein [Myxococcales bacterium]|nr:lysophospholipid acyltransferase family protein [Myxococcales bacterium]